MPEGVPVTTLDGEQFRRLLQSALMWLDRHHEIVNSLNVFPVPDGDTGTNMLLTMRSAVQETGRADSNDVSEVAHAAAQGALMGARGNSGVILSQILRGMSRSLDNQPTLTGPRLAAALTEGSRLAYKGVNRPVEGTILTVAREAATAAERAASVDPDLRFILQQAVHAADEAVALTPTLLPVLAQAGKVDSGGKGLFYVLEGMYRDLTDQPVEVARAEPIAMPVAVVRSTKGQRELPAVVYGFDVQCLIEGSNLDVDAIRDRIGAMGDCALVEGDSNLVKVHVHVSDPGVPLSYAVSLGFITDVVVENMDDMHLPEVPAEVAEVGVAADADADLANISGPGVIVVAQGAGVSEVFRSLGAHVIVSGGQTMNPSTRDILDAIQRLPVEEIIILPNNGNVVMAAQQAQALAGSGKRVAVVPTRSIPQGISALLALSPHADLERNVQTMAAAIDSIQTGEVTIAVHDANFDGVEVQVGDVIGLLNDRLTATGPDSPSVVKELLQQMNARELEVITLYYGEPVMPAEAEALLDELRAEYAGQEIEVISGGQPFYHYIISAE
jgi:DAK2 domain fusion protein YloV